MWSIVTVIPKELSKNYIVLLHIHTSTITSVVRVCGFWLNLDSTTIKTNKWGQNLLHIQIGAWMCVCVVLYCVQSLPRPNLSCYNGRQMCLVIASFRFLSGWLNLKISFLDYFSLLKKSTLKLVVLTLLTK